MPHFRQEWYQARAFQNTLRRRYFSRVAPLQGEADAICAEIIEKNWKGEYFTIGFDNFNFLWIRDFGTVAKSLIELGHGERVRKTVRWALDHYAANDEVTLCLTPSGMGFNMPQISIDGLAWFFHALVESKLPVSEAEKAYLQKELERFCAHFLTADGSVKGGLRFSELKDAVIYGQSAYAVTMLAVLKRSAESLGLLIPAPLEMDHASLLRQEYWNGSFFDADLGNHAFSAEANLFPFWTGVIEEDSKLGSVFDVISEKALNRPYPLKYTDAPASFRYYAWGKYVMPNYEGTTIWTWHGAIYLQLLQRALRPQFAAELEAFTALVVKHQNFPELLHPDGEWYQSWLYRGEEGMIWCAIFLQALRKAAATANQAS